MTVGAALEFPPTLKKKRKFEKGTKSRSLRLLVFLAQVFCRNQLGFKSSRQELHAETGSAISPAGWAAIRDRPVRRAWHKAAFAAAQILDRDRAPTSLRPPRRYCRARP